MLGLSASIYIAIYVAFLDPHVRAFLMLLAVLPCILAILSAPFINFVPFRQQEPHTKVSALSSNTFYIACSCQDSLYVQENGVCKQNLIFYAHCV